MPRPKVGPGAVRAGTANLKGAAQSFRRVCSKGLAAVTAHDGTDDEKPQARAFHLAGRGVLNAIEAIENTLQLDAGDANALVANTEKDAVDIRRAYIHDDVLVFSGILNGVVEKVEDRRAQFFGIAHGGLQPSRQRH